MTMAVKANWRGEEAKARAREGGVAGLKKWADDLLAASQPLVPVAPTMNGGFLRDSGRAQVDEGDALLAAVSYDGPADKPALPIWVHENMAFQHDVGQAKFLEGPLNGSKTTGPAVVGAAIKSRLGG
jgi:hypothetical protein